MAIIAASFDFVARMFELLSLGRQLVQLGAAALCQDGVAGVAVIGFDRPFAVGRLVQAVVAAETTRPVFVADVVRIRLPTSLHLGEEIICVDFLHSANRRPNARVVRITLGQSRRNGLERLRFVGIGLRQDMKRVGFDQGQSAVNLAQEHREVHRRVGGLVPVRRAVMAIHAVHRAQGGFVHGVGKLGSAELSNDPLGELSNTDVRDLLPRVIAGKVFDFVADVHVPVNAADRAMGGITTAHIHEHAHGEWRIGLVTEEVIVAALEIADELLGPVAFLAGFLGRPQVLDGRGNRARVFVGHGGIDLVGAR